MLKNSVVWHNSATTNGDDIGIQNFIGTADVNASFSDVGDIFIDPAAPGNYNDLGKNINLDPKFVDLFGGDLRLGTGSPAINKATAKGAPKVDFEGQARTKGTRPDMGADEFKSLAVLTPKAGDIWNIGTQQTITWLKGTGKANVRVQMSQNGGPWTVFTQQTADDGSHSEIVGGAATTQARIRVCKIGKKLKCGPSSPEFTIQ